MIKLQAGKYYKTSDGRKVGPLEQTPLGFFDGIHNYTSGGMAAGPLLDIISEWPSSPIREVTRRELVAGNYGCVAVTKNNKVMIAAATYTSSELREAAHTLNQIAELLESEGK